MDVTAFLDKLKSSPGYTEQIVHVHTEPAREATWAPVPESLRPELKPFLHELGIEKLYQHQATALDALLNGKDVLLTTGTASGKSLCFQLGILQRLVAEPTTTALLVFPAKALARDQADTWNRAVRALPPELNPESLIAHPYDGDSSANERRNATENARVLLTNPEMLHANLLPHHGQWDRFLSGLQTLVLDEVHCYTGFFGANMANVLRRLDRICTHHRSHPQFICCSATVGNPHELAERLANRSLELVDDTSSATGSRTYVFWNPPRIKKRQWRGRRSANVEAHELMARLVSENIATICFCKARNTAEMVYRYVRETLQEEAPALAGKVLPYRGGYTAEERRDIERRLKSGDLLGVSTTRALELGIDIGFLEASIIIGYPGVLNAFFQQAGRAGRSQADSVCFLVGLDTPHNQFVMEHPEYIFDRPIERVTIDQDNPFVILGHVRCASAELPIGEGEVPTFGYASPLALDVLEETQKVCHLEDAWYHSDREQPAYEVRLRGYGDESTTIMDIDTGELIDRMDKFKSLRLFYKGAIYFKHGDTYAMVHHDTERNHVTVRRVNVPYYTDPLTGTAVDHIDEILDQRLIGSGQACLGEVYAILDTPFYERVKFYTLDRISKHETKQERIAYEAMSFWLTPPQGLVNQILARGLNVDAGLRGIMYCVSKILPLFLTSDAGDFDWSLGAINSSPYTMYWYEYYLHGIGNAEQCFERLEEILTLALDHMLTCDCDDGCPNCTARPITPYHVRNVELGEGNQPHSRRIAVMILNHILNDKSLPESEALLEAPREKRGQQHLPNVIDKPMLSHANKMPLDDRTRRLMLRKIERERSAKPDINHAVKPRPEVGIPAPEDQATVDQSDLERRSGSKAIRHRSGLSRDLRKELGRLGKMKGGANGKIAKEVKRPPAKPATLPSPPKVTKPEPQPPPAIPGPITAGDPIARKAMKRRKKRK